VFESFHRWLERKLRIDAYELRGNEVVATGLPRRRIRLPHLRTWQSFYIGGGSPSVCVEFADGRKVDYSDRYEHLYKILHEVAADRELPFWTA
jgi:hypothetical protein